jgi:hypothetical protein
MSNFPFTIAIFIVVATISVSSLISNIGSITAANKSNRQRKGTNKYRTCMGEDNCYA